MANDTVVGLDLAKLVFYAVALNGKGKEQWKKKLRRNKVLEYFAELAPCTVAMEACGSAHYWGRELKRRGHQVVLLPPQHVKGYQRGQKNDTNDARAIAEACLHGRVRPVALKSVEQHDEQAFDRIRQRLTKERTALTNQIRGLLGEYGVFIAKGISRFRREIPFILEAADNGLTPSLRGLIQRQYQHFQSLDEQVDWYDEQIAVRTKADEVCQRLQALPGFGPIVSSVFKGWVGDGSQFRRGRDASAALGIVPRQYGTGGQTQLLGITKRGDKHLRTLVIHGARAVVRHAAKKDDPLSVWINRLVSRRGHNKAVVALANKLVRMAWVIVARGERYAPHWQSQAVVA